MLDHKFKKKHGFKLPSDILMLALKWLRFGYYDALDAGQTSGIEELTDYIVRCVFAASPPSPKEKSKLISYS